MNCFFASCEIAENPELKGKKMAVGHLGHDRKGIILSASYEARPYGIHAAMPVFEALQKCPDLIVVEPHHELYGDYSRRFFDYFLSITPLVEPASVDEGFLDVTDVCSPSMVIELAHTIQNDLLNDFKLPCSIGIGPNKFLAKMASDMKKPLGITVLRKREIDKLMWPLPISEMFGIGKKSLETFLILGIKTIGDLANYQNLPLLYEAIGKNNADGLIARAHGEGSNEIEISRFTEAASISNSMTFDKDEYDIGNMLLNIKIMSNNISNRLEKNNIKALTFTIKIKYFNFRQTSKSKTIEEPINNDKAMAKLFEELFNNLYEPNIPVRLLGVGVSKLKEGIEEIRQFSFFDNLDKEEKAQQILNIINNINKNFNDKILKQGITIKENKDLTIKSQRKTYYQDQN